MMKYRKDVNNKNSKTKDSKKSKSYKIVLFWGFIILTSISGILLLVWLNIPYKNPLNTAKQENFSANITISETNRLIIPKIAVNSEIYDGDITVLKKGTWHRYPTYGNPKSGGNFILAAHRYIFSPDPRRVVKESILYNIDKLDIGDTIFVDWSGVRYKYSIKNKYLVKPDATEIESPSTAAKLTLYSCTKKGSLDGREVIEAVLAN